MYKGEYLYHATGGINREGILKEGISCGFDGCVYLAESYDDAMNLWFLDTLN